MAAVPRRTLPQLYARWFGWGLVVAAALGFAGVLDVDAWHSALHLVTGLIGLAAWRSAAGARAYALVFGLGYLALGVLGEATVPHVLIGGAGLLSALVPPGTPAPSTA